MALWEAISRDHCHAGLIWDEACRTALRDALAAEEAGLQARRRQVAAQGVAASPCWNHGEFLVTYPSLSRHLCLGGIYVRKLVDATDPGAVSKVPNPRELFQAMHQHLLCLDSHLLLLCHDSDSAGQARAAIQPTLQSSAVADVEETQILCLRAMSALYQERAGAIGPLDGLSHLLSLLDRALRRPLRHHLLLLIKAVLEPASTNVAQTGSALAQRAARANAATLIDAGGVELLLDLAAAAHELSDGSLATITGAVGTATPGSSWNAGALAAGQLLTTSSHGAGIREWYCYPKGVLQPPPVLEGQPETEQQPGSEAVVSAQAQAQSCGARLEKVDGSGRAGPFSKEELLTLWKGRRVHTGTLCWAEGQAAPGVPLGSIRELRWLVSGGAPVLGAQDVAVLSLQLLLTLARLQPAVDASGCLLQPLPRVMRILGGPRCLPILAQVLLTHDPQLVPLAASLIEATLSHHGDALARLYRTGSFFFCLSYAGSNLQQVASLMHTAHLRQAHRGAGAEAAAGATLAERSYLGHLLPESLLFCMDSYGAEAFATALAGDADTPELRWTHIMRFSRLVSQLTAHLGDLPQRLAQNWSGVRYEYTPAPPVSYPELKDEIWCHRYYLRALCDEHRFVEIKIVDHVQLLQALLAAWRSELARQPLSMSETEACAILGIQETSGVVPEADVRSAYRAMARKFHPDKNPAGRTQFQRVQVAYERLQAGLTAGQGPQAWRIALILQATNQLYRRYSNVLSAYKYAGCTLLVDLLSSMTQKTASMRSVPSGSASTAGIAAAGQQGPTPGQAGSVSTGQPSKARSDMSGDDKAEVMQAATQLAWRVCCSSLQNSEEFGRAGGVKHVASLLQHLPLDTSPTAPDTIQATYLLRALAGFAAAPASRAAVVAAPGLLSTVMHFCGLQAAHAAGEAALLLVGHLAGGGGEVTVALLKEGVLQHVVPLLFRYDTTLSPEAALALLLPFSRPTPTQQSAAAAATAAAAAASGQGTVRGGATAAPAATASSRAGAALSAAVAHSFLALDTPLVRASETVAQSQRAVLAAQVLGRLAGLLPEPHATPACPAAQQALSALLTPGLSARLRESDPRSLLTILNTSQETAQVIWNSAMRDELLEGLSASGGDLAVSDDPAHQLSSWQFSALKGALQVGGVYVRIFCSKPAALPHDIQAFCKALVRYLYDRFAIATASATLLTDPSRSEELRDVLSVLCALGLLLDAEPRLLGLLASKSAQLPLVAALQVAETLAYTASLPPGDGAALQGQPQTGVLLAGELAEASLLILQRLLAHSACLEALVDVSTARLLFQTVHCAPSAHALQLATHVLRAMAGHAAVGEAAAEHAGALMLLTVLTHPPGTAWPWPGGEVSTAGQADNRGQDQPLSSQSENDRPPPSEVGKAATVSEAALLVEGAALMARLLNSSTHGTAITLQLQRVLPPGLVGLMASTGDPHAAVTGIRGRTENPELIWEPAMLGQAAVQIATWAATARQQQAVPGASLSRVKWALPAGAEVRYERLLQELYCGGVYCRLYLKDPLHPLREPLRFGDSLADSLDALLRTPISPANVGVLAGTSMSHSDTVVLLSAAGVALVRHHQGVADRLASQGFVQKLVSLLSTRVVIPAPGAFRPAAPQTPEEAGALVTHASPAAQPVVDEGGAVLRLLHALCASVSASETLAASPNPPGAMTVLAAAQAWGPAAQVLVLECWKRALSPSNRSRDVLIAQALQAGILHQLLQILDWKLQPQDQLTTAGGATQSGYESGLAVLRTLAVDVVSLMCLEGGPYTPEISAQLESSEVWAAYRGTRHDLFLPAGANASGSVVGLLSGPASASFALPAPERSDDL